MGDNSHVDLETLETLKEVMEDEFQVLIDTFINDSIQKIASLKTAIAEKNADDMCKLAHSFKGSCSNIGAVHLSDLCAQLEERGVEGIFSGSSQLILDIEQEYKAVCDALSSL